MAYITSPSKKTTGPHWLVVGVAVVSQFPLVQQTMRHWQNYHIEHNCHNNTKYWFVEL